MTHTIRYASFGSVSSGTLLTEDLLDALSSELDYQMSRQSKRFPRRELRKLVNAAERVSAKMAEGDDLDDAAEGDDIVIELFDALEQFAPPYGYFGANAGDGSCFGFWRPWQVNPDMGRCVMLHSGERKQLAHFVLQCAAERASILQGAVNDPKISGPLIAAYRAIEPYL